VARRSVRPHMSQGLGTISRRRAITLRMTPAMAAGVTPRLWTSRNQLDLLIATEPRPAA
jgi:hypothetical protein